MSQMRRTTEPDNDAPGTPGAPEPSHGEPTGRQADDVMVVERTRVSSTFVMTAVGLVLALLMLVFVLQNGDDLAMEFLWFDVTLPVGVAMLLAAVVGGLIVSLLALGRVLQLRLAARRHREADRAHR